MFEFRWIQMVLDLILVLQFTAVGQEPHPSVIARDGDEVTLPCESVIKRHVSCDSAAWHFSRFPKAAAVQLVTDGQIHKKAGAKSARLSVTENCSLAIRKVSAEDAGLYFCLKHKSEDKQGRNPHVHLSVVTVTEHEADDGVTLNCSVSTRGQCRHTVKWHFSGTDGESDDLRTSQSYCSASVATTTSRFSVLKCNVTDSYSKNLYQFTFGPEPSGRNKNAHGNNDAPSKPEDRWWLYVLVAVGAAALSAAVVALVRRERKKGRKTQLDENRAAPEDSVSYASISFTKKFNSKAQVRDDDDAVTYSTVRASSSPV